MIDAEELKLIRAILALRRNADRDFTAFGAYNVFEAIELYLQPVSTWTQTRLELFEEMLAAAAVDPGTLERVWQVLGGPLEGSVAVCVRPLIKPFRDYNGRNPGSLSWPLSYRAPFEFAPSLAGKFDFEIASDVRLRAYATPPSPVRGLLSPDQAVLAAGLEGTAAAATGVSLPFNLSSVGASADGRYQISTQSYFKHEPDRLIGEAMLEDLTRICVPFARGFIHRQFLSVPSLVMVAYSTRGEASLGARLGVVAPLACGPLVGANLRIEASYRLTSVFETRVSRLADGSVNVRLDSRDANAVDAGAELGVELDLSQPLLPIHEALSGTLAEAKDLIDLLQTQWTFENGIGDLVAQNLAGISDNGDWLEFVESVLDPAAEAPLLDAARSSLSEKLRDRGISWRNAATTAIGDLLDAALAGMDTDDVDRIIGAGRMAELQTMAHAAIRDALDEAAAHFLDTAATASESLVNKLVGKADLKHFKRALDQVAPAGNKLADTRRQVLQYLNRYVSCLRITENAMRTISANQLSAKMSYYRSRARGSSALADITVTRHAAERYSESLDELLAGKPDKLIAQYNLGEPGITINQCLLGRFVESQKSVGFGLTVLDFKLERQSLLTSEVEFIEDHIAGLVTVGTRAAIRKAQTLASDSRSIELVNVAQLSSARVTGTGGLSATFNRKEDTLEQEELAAFLQGFVDAGVMSEQQQDIALSRAYVSTGVTLDILEDAEIVAGIRWSDEHLRRLFALESPIAFQDVFYAVVTALERLQVFDERDFKRINDLRKSNQNIESTEEMIAFFTTDEGERLRRKIGRRRHSGRPGSGTPAQSAGHQRDRQAADKGYGWARNITRLHEAIVIMREVYHSSDAPWSREQYQEQQDRLNRKLQNWIQLPGVLSSLYAKLPWASASDDRVKDHTLALIVAFIQLTATEGTETGFTVDLRLPAAIGRSTIRLV